jgi:hypothetical protein
MKKLLILGFLLIAFLPGRASAQGLPCESCSIGEAAIPFGYGRAAGVRLPLYVRVRHFYAML